MVCFAESVVNSALTRPTIAWTVFTERNNFQDDFLNSFFLESSIGSSGSGLSPRFHPGIATLFFELETPWTKYSKPLPAHPFQSATPVSLTTVRDPDKVCDLRITGINASDSRVPPACFLFSSLASCWHPRVSQRCCYSDVTLGIPGISIAVGP